MQCLVKMIQDVPAAIIPTRAHPFDAGWDLYALEGGCIPTNSRVLASTGIRMAIPNGWVGMICERSGLAVKGIGVGGGIIDASYRGVVKVVLCNNSDTTFYFTPGTRIAQIVFLPLGEQSVILVNDTTWNRLLSTTRGEGGFGRSGTTSSVRLPSVPEPFLN